MCIPEPSRSRQHGLTMVELVLFMVIVSVAVVGVLQILNVTTRHSGDPQMRKQALSIAEGLLEEVMLAQFTFCDPTDAQVETATSPAECANPVLAEGVGPETGNARPFDNVNDYVTAFGVPQPAFNANPADANSTLVDAAGNPVAGTGTYRALLTIRQEDLAPVTVPPTAPAVALRVTVTVSYGTEALALEGYRTRYAPNFTP
jgi:MSHA pilin protein MshD